MEWPWAGQILCQEADTKPDFFFWYLFIFNWWLFYSIVFISVIHQHELAIDVHMSRRTQWHPTPVLLPGQPRGRRSLVGCSPWGCEESDVTERLHFNFSLLCIGEGNGNPLQCSCLENPRMGSHRVGHDLKWLSSSSSTYVHSHLKLPPTSHLSPPL